MFTEVRIYSLPDENFKLESDVIDYFCNKLPNQGYVFHFYRHGIRCKRNTLLFFQYNKYIIAKAVVLERKGLKLYLQSNTVKLSNRRVLTSELGVEWFPDNDESDTRLLTTHVQQGPLFINPKHAVIIDRKCFR